MSSSDRNSPPLQSPGAAGRRRSSFVDLFNSRPPPNTAATQSGTPALPGPITTAAAQAQRRRLSLSTVGLSGSPNQTSPFGNVRSRGESVSSANSSSVDESPFEETDGPSGSVPSTPFGRRLSFGARALQSVRTGNGNGHSNGQGFDYAENLRSRAERSSISSAPGVSNSGQMHQRAKSVTIMEPPVMAMPQQAKRPDAFQERILKGDFYMD